MIISNAKRQVKGKEEKFNFEDLKSVGDKDYGINSGNRDPLMNRRASDGSSRKNFYLWLTPADQRYLDKRLRPWNDLKHSFSDL